MESRAADHRNKPDVASSIALAVSQIAKEKDKILLDSRAAPMDVTSWQCAPNTIVWSFDPYEKAHSTGGALSVPKHHRFLILPQAVDGVGRAGA